MRSMLFTMIAVLGQIEFVVLFLVTAGSIIELIAHRAVKRGDRGGSFGHTIKIYKTKIIAKTLAKASVACLKPLFKQKDLYFGLGAAQFSGQG